MYILGLQCDFLALQYDILGLQYAFLGYHGVPDLGNVDTASVI